MNMPEFTAEASLGPPTRLYRGRASALSLGASNAAFLAQALMGSTAMPGPVAASTFRRQGSLGFTCRPGSCICIGIDDCLDMIITTDLCGPQIDCSEIFGTTVCTCTRN
jgi:hypothetical protein